ncbi:hypothetical protein [Burkholderia sp. LMG 32019]|uniref:hypothetical protein n=1 Tax=Burkholderia sp. LMG 32019 TaxID=3158173 RepID=UPI003C2C543B
MKVLGLLFFGLCTAIFLLQLVRPGVAARLNVPQQPRPKLILLLIVGAALTLGSIALMFDGHQQSSDSSSNTAFAQASDNPKTQWDSASKEANDVFVAGRKVYDSGNAPPTCASALKSQFELGQKVQSMLQTAMNTVNGMGGIQNPDAKAYFASALRTASSEIGALNDNTRTSCGL